MNEELIEETESKYTYTKIKQSTEILAMGKQQLPPQEIKQLMVQHILKPLILQEEL